MTERRRMRDVNRGTGSSMGMLNEVNVGESYLQCRLDWLASRQ